MPSKAPLTIIFITIFIDLVGFGMIIPVLPIYAESFGATGLEVGLLAASFSLMQFFFMPVWGRLSDRVGRKPVLLMSLACTGVAFILFGLANSLLTLFLSRILAGVFTANISTAQAYIADVTSPEERAKGMGLIGAAFGLGFIFGPPIGGLLSLWGLGVPGFFAGGMAFCNAIAAYYLLAESRPKDAPAQVISGRWQEYFSLRKFKQAVLHPVIGAFLILFFFVVLAFANLETTFVLMTERNFGYLAFENSLIFMFIGAVAALVNGVFIGPLVKKFGESSLLTLGITIQAIAFLVLPYTLSLWTLLLASGAVALGSGLTNPTLQSLISRNTGKDEQGGVLGVTQSLGSLARVFGPAWGGLFFDKLGVPAPYWSGGLLLFGCAMLSLYAISRMQRGKAELEIAAADI
jgi:MFS family permease